MHNHIEELERLLAEASNDVSWAQYRLLSGLIEYLKLLENK